MHTALITIPIYQASLRVAALTEYDAQRFLDHYSCSNTQIYTPLSGSYSSVPSHSEMQYGRASQGIF
ncbi:MAG: hypothetical protein ACOVSW_22045 [Candidatus Kapaibacteriota bacterium]